ncbi:MAG: hypothetical protein OEY87_04175 [Gammaproteobacteria bacterium]|nr:hypothetical protein [Gammaproteobacteria bacterium]MDH5735300.1 hypothetical protein [Gammaproteobacteria bacterium]
MKFTVNQHNDTSVSIMTDMGYVLGYFASVDEALNICDEWYSINNQEYKFDVDVIPSVEQSISNKLLGYFTS